MQNRRVVPGETFAEPFATAVPSTVPDEFLACTLPEVRPLAIDATTRRAAVLTFVQMVKASFVPLSPLPV